MTTPLQATSTLFVDEFTRDGTIDSSYWDYHVWRPDDGSSFYGNTQQRQELPIAQDGVLRLKLDTFNPTNGPGSQGKRMNTFCPSEHPAGSHRVDLRLFCESGML